MKRWLMLAMILLAGSSARAQENYGTVSIYGRVSAAFQMEPVQEAGAVSAEVSVYSEGQDRVRIDIQPAAQGQGGGSREVLVWVMLRTNASSYRLQAAQLGGSGLRVSFGAPHSSGQRVHPNAARDFSSPLETVLSEQEQVAASGSRISLRGRFTSPDNALLVPVRVVLNPEDGFGTSSVRLSLGN